MSSSPPPLVSIISTDEVFSSQGRVSVSNPFRRAPAHALKGCDKEDESDVTFTAFCLPTLLSWSACPFESSKSAARQRKLNQGFFSSILLGNKWYSTRPFWCLWILFLRKGLMIRLAFTMRLLREDSKSNKLAVLRSA